MLGQDPEQLKRSSRQSGQVLALDPGETTGFSLASFASGNITVIQYGIIPTINTTYHNRLSSLHAWLDWACETFGLLGSQTDIVYEDLIQSYKLKTRKEATEIRGVIKSWCGKYKPVDSFGYTPQQVRAQLSLPQQGGVKAQMKDFVTQALGWLPAGPDHVTDAFGVMLCHALKCNLWDAELKPLCNVPIKPQRRTTGIPRVDSGHMTVAEYRKYVRLGYIKE